MARRSSTRTVETIRALIPSVLKGTKERQRAIGAIRRRWTGLVGRRLAMHSRPVTLWRGRLVVHVDQPGDSFELSYQRERLLERLRSLVKEPVEELVIRSGDLPCT
ncbi:MAG: DUF721 domain-containing protein [Candidatus Omnitrophota bacterium]|nr:DUF721 domain-containing protein [Candidatus Omnitrophota bacterium]